MGQRVLVGNAFATEPLTGEPFVIIPEGSLSETQRRQLGSEFGTVGAVWQQDGALRYTGAGSPVGAAVAGCTGLFEQGVLTGEDVQFEAADFPEVEELSFRSREVLVSLAAQSIDEPTVAEDDVAAALGLSVDSLKDVGADLPFGRSKSDNGTLIVPVNFLEHLRQATPVSESFRQLCDECEVSRVIAFTFDTLSPDSAVHARTFTIAASNEAGTETNQSESKEPLIVERPVDGLATGACSAYLSAHAAFDGEYDRIQCESGHFIDRPSKLSVTVASQPTISGHGITVLEGTAVIPEDDGDDIIEAR